jgi:uncharacterized protein (DUF885 family)
MHLHANARSFANLLAAVRLIPFLIIAVSACSKAPLLPASPAVTSANGASQAWAEFSQRFIAAYFKAQPFFAAQAGRHEFDGQMPDLSEAGIKQEIARLHQAQTELDAIDGAQLTPRQQFDRDYLRAVISGDLFWLEKAQFPFKNPAWYVDHLDPDVYLTREYAPLATRMKAYIAYARTIPKIATDIRNNLRMPLPKSYIDYGVKAFGGFAEFYQRAVPGVFASVQDADLQQQLTEADAAAAKAMRELADWLSSERQRATNEFALGKELFAQMLQDTEGVELPLAQIEAAGRADLERNLAALKTACAQYLPGAALRVCMSKMAAHKPQGSAVEVARAQLQQLKAFIEHHRVITIPSRQEALVAEAPPYNRSNGAYISVPGPYDRNVASTYYIAPPDPSWSKAEQAAYIPSLAVLTFTSAHEVWPGHFLQFLHSNNNPIKLEGLWVGYGFAEGWAHYSEEMMYEMGLGQGSDPHAIELHIGQLSEALLRDVRLLSAIGLHTHGMTLSAAEQMFREQAFQDPGNARQQAARGTYDPAYLNYTLGKLELRKLRTDWLQQHGAAADDQQRWHEFHDQVLSYGGPPLPLLRKQLLGESASGALL